MNISDTYSISVSGDVTNRKTGRVLKPHIAGAGYKYIRLGAGPKYTIHKLVASVWLPAPTSDTCVIDHIDRDKLNNHASNLRWVSRSENATNRTIERRPRQSNTFGHHHIKRVMTKRQLTPTYAVVFNTKDFKHYSIHPTLDAAIKKRDSLL
jgi:hypothetical protein